MNLPRLKRYQKKFDFSYAFGAYPVLDLLNFRKEQVLKVFFKKDGYGSDGVSEILKVCKESNIPFEENDKVIDRISFKENTYVVAVFNTNSYIFCNITITGKSSKKRGSTEH